ncbi:carboxypeptidase-like regulatory domain-containing protein [Polaribacter sejongensis]|uniref:carboxypeptidase-like regulatory domain-containing protein n=1 Tax=Polaribacter sejongensis TaxID=985043 RepID=UPI0035A63A63
MKQFYNFNLLLLTLLLSLSALNSVAQTSKIQGLITDKDGLYVPGANVLIEALKKGDISNFDGKFTIVGVPLGTHTIRITYLGFKDILQEVVVKKMKLLL